MKKTIYIVRHGQTDYNKADLVQGRGIDAPLNGVGEQQARAFYASYKNVSFQKLYTSELQRTHQTLVNFIKDGIPWQQLSGLDEMFYGDLEGKPINGEGGDEQATVRRAWANGNCDIPMPNGESPVLVRERQKTAVATILAGDEETVLVAMHGRALKILLCWLLGKDLKEMDSFSMPNSCLYVLKYDYDTKTFELLTEGSVEHLEAVLDS